MLEVRRGRDLADHVGETVGVSDWVDIDQPLIDAFAALTGDDQWIHVDVERAERESPHGATIAHGYLLLAMLPRFTPSLYVVRERRQALNYGLNKVRFTSAVPAGSRVRLRLAVHDVEVDGERTKVVWDGFLELEGSDRPAMVVQSVSLIFD